jgi:hypothetical protein
VGKLQSALDALAAEDLKPMLGPQLLDRLATLVRAQNRIAAEVARTVRECELTGAAESDGLKTMQSWLRGHAHLADGEAARLVGAGRALEQLPAVAAGFAEGTITAGQVEMIARVAAPRRTGWPRRPRRTSTWLRSTWLRSTWLRSTARWPRPRPRHRTRRSGRPSGTTWFAWIPTVPNPIRPGAAGARTSRPPWAAGRYRAPEASC